jgi:hypothetical protein
MHGAITMLLGGILGLLGLASAPAPQTAAPDPEAEIRACLQTCDASDDETDRVTCRLNCRQATEGKDDVHITKWKKERYVGGTVPGQDAPPPPVTTVTTVTPSGTTTEVKTEAGPKVVAPPTLPAAVQPSPRQKYYFGLVGCQERCDATADAAGRARCKLRCLRLQPGPPPAAAPAKATGRPTSSKAPARTGG